MTKFESTLRITNNEIRIHESITNVRMTNDARFVIRSFVI